MREAYYAVNSECDPEDVDFMVCPVSWFNVEHSFESDCEISTVELGGESEMQIRCKDYNEPWTQAHQDYYDLGQALVKLGFFETAECTFALEDKTEDFLVAEMAKLGWKMIYFGDYDTEGVL